MRGQFGPPGCESTFMSIAAAPSASALPAKIRLPMNSVCVGNGKSSVNPGPRRPGAVAETAERSSEACALAGLGLRDFPERVLELERERRESRSSQLPVRDPDWKVQAAIAGLWVVTS